MEQSKSLTRMLRVLRETVLVQLFQSATAAYMLLVKEADLLSTFNIISGLMASSEICPR